MHEQDSDGTKLSLFVKAMLRILTKKHSATQASEDWHRDVTAIAGTARPTDADFPWSQLQKCTEVFVKKNNKLVTEQLDERLLVLIQQAAVKEVAVAACAHALSPRNARKLLVEDLYVGPSNYFGLVTYLQAIIAASRVKPEAASASEAYWARKLLRHLGTPMQDGELGKELANIFSILADGMTADSLLRMHIATLARNTCQRFAERLAMLRINNQWVHAHATAAWLSTFSAKGSNLPSGGVGPVQLLNIYLPAWQAWAAWRPNMARLRFLEGNSIHRNDLLRDLLVIEGPDFTNTGKAKLEEGLLSQDSGLFPKTISWGNIHIELRGSVPNEARSIIERLSNAIDTACVAGQDFIALLAHLCVGKAMSYEKFQILEGIYSMPQHLTSAVLYIYTRPHDDSGTQIAMIRQLLPFLAHARTSKLRESLAPFLINSVTEYVETKQSDLCERMEAGKPWDGNQIDLLAFGKELQGAPWLIPLLDPSLRTYIQSIINGPPMEVINLLESIRISAQSVTPSNGDSLISQIDAYCKAWLIPHCKIDASSRLLVQSLVRLWDQYPDSKRRNLALRIAQYPNTDVPLRCMRLTQMVTLDDDFVTTLLAILQDCKETSVRLIVKFVAILASETRAEVVKCWRMLLYREIQKHGDQLVDQALANLTARDWLSWLHLIKTILSDMVDWFSPILLSPDLHGWAALLLDYLPTLERLEQSLGHPPALKCLLTGPDVSTRATLCQILTLVKQAQGTQRQRVMEFIINRLARSGSNADDIGRTLSIMIKTTSEGAVACVSMLDVYEKVSPSFAEVIAAGLLQTAGLQEIDRTALRALVDSCDLYLDADDDAAAESFEVAANSVEENFQELLAKARRLENLRLSLSAVDPIGVSKLLARLDIEAPSCIDDMLACLPSALVEMVERVGENEIELQFPISNLKKLQRIAIVAGDARSFLVRINMDPQGWPVGFCVHLLGNDLSTSKTHSPWDVFIPSGNRRRCFATNRGEYQLSRVLWRHFRDSFVSLENTYAFICANIPEMAWACVVCGRGKARLRRSTFCQDSQCRALFWRESSEILLADIWQNPTVMDLLLSMVHATAVTSHMELLTNCPTNDAATVLRLLAEVPAIDALGKHLKSCINVYGDNMELSKSLSGYSSNPDLLARGLIWACNSYRGFLTPAVDQLRIPSFGPHQFFLANAAPELETAFAANITASQSISRTLFHGTSLDRLHAILCQGLKVCSGTSLQRHGAAYGNGIYMADEPATAWGYANSVYRTNTVAGWKNSTFTNHRVLLGCELAGEKPGTNGIHVISDASRLMVRWIFLMDQNARVPAAKDVRPAMQSALASLRSGAI